MSDIPLPPPPPDVPNPIQQMLGANWQAGQLGWSWMKASSPAGTFHLLLLETATGRVGFGFSEADLEELIRQAQTNLTGLVLPRFGEVQL